MTTKVNLQVIANTDIEICVVNFAESQIRFGDAKPNDINETYCRHMYSASYDGYTINKSAPTLPTPIVDELTDRMNKLVPLLLTKLFTCQEVFTARSVHDIKSSYPSYANNPIYIVEIELKGCPTPYHSEL
ncbi:MAG: hypothetical protein RIT35_1220 [Pseudomonadota bacterium]|jgi:hypothetical protein